MKGMLRLTFLLRDEYVALKSLCRQLYLDVRYYAVRDVEFLGVFDKLFA